MTTHHHHATEVPWHAAHLVGRRFTLDDTQHAARSGEVVDVFADRFGTWAVFEWDEPVGRRETYMAHTFDHLVDRPGVAGWKAER